MRGKISGKISEKIIFSRKISTNIVESVKKLEKFPEIFPNFFFFRKNINSIMPVQIRIINLPQKWGIYIYSVPDSSFAGKSQKYPIFAQFSSMVSFILTVFPIFVFRNGNNERIDERKLKFG